jgi:hypothetical protein
MMMAPVRVPIAIVHVQAIASIEAACSAKTSVAALPANTVRTGRRSEQSRGSQSCRRGSHERNHAHGVISFFLRPPDNVLQTTWFLGPPHLVL